VRSATYGIANTRGTYTTTNNRLRAPTLLRPPRHIHHSNMPTKKDKGRVRQPTRRKKVGKTSATALPSTGASKAVAESTHCSLLAPANEDQSGKMMCYGCGAISTRDYLGIWDVHDLSTWAYGVVTDSRLREEIRSQNRTLPSVPMQLRHWQSTSIL
jgi:hypothetical protein